MENNLYPKIYDQKENKIKPNMAGIVLIVLVLYLIYYYIIIENTKEVTPIVITPPPPASPTTPASSPPVPIVPPYQYLGCYKYPEWSNITPLENVGNIKGDYKLRVDPIQKCYIEAKAKNQPFFGVMDGGRCMGLSELQYKLKGTSDKCLADGEGGPWANAVYKINN